MSPSGRQRHIATRQLLRPLCTRNQPSRPRFSIFRIGRPLTHQEQTIYCREYRAAIRLDTATFGHSACDSSFPFHVAEWIDEMLVGRYVFRFRVFGGHH